MACDIRSADGKRSVQHSKQEGEAITLVASAVLPFSPDESGSRIRLAINVRHYGAHYDRDKKASDDKEPSDLFQTWQSSIREENERSNEPGQNDVCNEYHPSRLSQFRMGQSVHGHKDVGAYLERGGRCKHPGEEVQPACKVSDDLAMAPASDSGPMID